MSKKSDRLICEQHDLDGTLEYQKCVDYIVGLTDFEVGEAGRHKIADLLYQFGYPEVIVALQIAFDYYWSGDKDDIDTAIEAFRKVGGICYNRLKSRNGEEA